MTPVLLLSALIGPFLWSAFRPFVYFTEDSGNGVPNVRLALNDQSGIGKNLICIAWGKGRNRHWHLWLRLGWRIGGRGLFRLV